MEKQELVIMLDAEVRDELRLIVKALHRLDEDNYDQCSKCGELIGDTRLEALPFTETCIVCANEVRK